MSEKLQSAKDLLDRDKSHDAAKLLTKIDTQYGGLAAPESINLAGRIGAPLTK
jgi:hypothetical protein